MREKRKTDERGCIGKYQWVYREVGPNNNLSSENNESECLGAKWGATLSAVFWVNILQAFGYIELALATIRVNAESERVKYHPDGRTTAFCLLGLPTTTDYLIQTIIFFLF